MADGLVKRGEIYHYDFVFLGKRHQGSTRLKNKAKALEVVRKIRTDLALGEHGIGPQKASPLFKDFMRIAEKAGESHGAFLDYVERHAKAKNTREFYKKRTAQLLKFPGFKDKRLSEIDGELVEKYSEWRRAISRTPAEGIAAGSDRSGSGVGPTLMIGRGMPAISTNTLNGELKTLRKALKLAEEWGLLKKAPKVRQLPGGRGRDFVVSPALEKLYLEKATYPLKQIATLILDLGLRPEECVSARKTDIHEQVIHVRQGKTKNATRSLPMTDRAIHTVDLLNALFPDSLYLFPGKRAGTHLTRGAADDLHAALRGKLAAIAQGTTTEPNVIADRDVILNSMPANAKDFVLHGFRHTFCTRLAESGANPYEIMRLMGHSDLKQALTYIHVDDSSIRLAMKRLEMMQKLLRGEVHDLASDPIASTLAERHSGQAPE